MAQLQAEVVQEAQPTGARKGALAFIFSVVLLDLIGLTLLGPVQAYIVRQYNTDALTVSLLTVIYAAAQFAAAPLLGRLSDRYGRRPVLLLSVLGSAAGYVMFGIGGALWVLFLSRLIDGFTGGNIAIASAYVADVTPPEERAKNFALIGIAFGLGFIIGPALGGALAQISLSAPAYAAGALSLASAVLGFFVLPESLPPERRTRGRLRLAELNPLASIVDMARRPGLGALLLVQSLFFFAFNGTNAISTVFMIEKFGALPYQLALLFLAGGIANVVVQGGLIGRLAPVFGERRLALTSLAIQALCLVGTVVAPAFWLLYVVSVASSIGLALIWPTLGALIANRVPAEDQGQVSGVSTALSGLMSVFGPLWAGATYDSAGAWASYGSGAVLLAIAFVFLAGVRGSHPTRSPSPFG